MLNFQGVHFRWHVGDPPIWKNFPLQNNCSVEIALFTQKVILLWIFVHLKLVRILIIHARYKLTRDTQSDGLEKVTFLNMASVAIYLKFQGCIIINDNYEPLLFRNQANHTCHTSWCSTPTFLRSFARKL